MCVKNLPMIAIWTRTAGNRTHDLQLASSMPPGCTIWLRGHYKWLSYYADRLHWRSVALTKYKLSPNLDFHPHNSFSLETLKRPHFVVAVDITSKRSLAAAILFYCTRYQYLPIRIPRFPLSVHYSHYPYPQLLRSLTPGLTPIFSKKFAVIWTLFLPRTDNTTAYYFIVSSEHIFLCFLVLFSGDQHSCRHRPYDASVRCSFPLPNYTAWWQQHMGVNNLPTVLTQQR